jgi:vanillate O-demethylase monooxygenase subunit
MDMSWIKNAWQVAAFANEVADGLVSRTYCGVQVVLYRTQTGRAVAMRDQCAHRLVPLSLGKQVGDDLQCGYHGMRFGADGVCTRIPGQTRIPDAARVQTFPVQERHKLIWIWLGAESLADPELIPDLHWMDDEGWTVASGYFNFACNYRLVTDNLLDLSHESYLHRRTIGNAKVEEDIADYPVKVTSEEQRLIRAHREMPGVIAPPFFARFLGGASTINRWQSAIYMPPGIHMTNVGFYPANTSRAEALSHIVLHLLTPETETSTHYFWAHARNHFQANEEIDMFIQAGGALTLGEDKEMLEAQQRSLTAEPGTMVPKVGIGIDVAAVRARGLLQRMIEAELENPQAVVPPIALAPDGPLSEKGTALAAA